MSRRRKEEAKERTTEVPEKEKSEEGGEKEILEEFAGTSFFKRAKRIPE